MENEEQIIEEYILGQKSGEDNKLRAAIGNLNANRTRELSDSIDKFQNQLFISTNDLNAGIRAGVDDLTNVFHRSLLETKDQLQYLNKNLSNFNNQSSKLQFWLILWTAVIALATLANVFITTHWWPFK